MPLLKRFGAKFSQSEQQRGRSFTLPSLTARYLKYIDDVQRVLGKQYGSPKLIICIDELDKITDPEQVGNVLREIKGALYKENCFYLLSISEDAVRAFEGRLIEQRDIFESTFDEILFLERLDLLSELEDYLRLCDDRYDAATVAGIITQCRARNAALAATMAGLEAQSEAATQDFRVAALTSDIEKTANWIRCWVELEIHLLVRLCSLTCGKTDIPARTQIFAALLVTYAGLPYSTELTARRLAEFKFTELPAAAE